MSLWKKEDSVDGAPIWIADKTTLVFVDNEEANDIRNKNIGFTQGAGWYKFKRYVTFDGKLRHKVEQLVAMKSAPRADVGDEGTGGTGLDPAFDDFTEAPSGLASPDIVLTVGSDTLIAAVSVAGGTNVRYSLENIPSELIDVLDINPVTGDYILNSVVPTFTDGTFDVVASNPLGSVRLTVNVSALLNPLISINVERAEVVEARVAPDGVIFEAETTGFIFKDFGNPAIYKPECHEIHYEWDFGDNRSPWTAPRLPSEFNEPSKGSGKRLGHVFVAPGTYTVTCAARQVISTDPLNIRIATNDTQVTVGDPDASFAASRTIIMARDGNFAGAPTGDIQITTGAQLDTEFAALRATAGPIRIRLKRGEDYRADLDFIDAFNTNTIDAHNMLRCDAWGNPVDPKPLVPRVPRSVPFNSALIVTDLHFKGDYDPDTDTFLGTGTNTATNGSVPGSPVANLFIEGPAHYVFSDFDATDALQAFTVQNDGSEPLPGGNWTTNTIFFDNCRMDRHRNYAVFMNDQARDFASFTGCSMVDDTNQVCFSTADGNNTHSGLRAMRGGTIYIDGTDFFVRGGWSPLGGTWSDGATAIAPQPCIRFSGRNADVNGIGYDILEENGYSYVCRCVMEHPGSAVSVTTTVTGPQLIGNGVFERNLFVGGAVTMGFITAETGNLTVRANLFVKPDTLERGLRNFVSASPEAFGEEQGVTLELLQEGPIQVYGNTFAILFDNAALAIPAGGGEDIPLLDAAGGWQNVVEANNILYAPQWVTARPDKVNFTPDTTVLFPPRYLGRRNPDAPDNGVMNTSFATPADSISFLRPSVPGEIPVIDSPDIPVFDLLGSIAGDAALKGAITNPFLPDDLAPLAWWDAADTATISLNGFGAVSQWENKGSSSANLVQAVGDNQPTTGSVTIGGVNALQFEQFDYMEAALDLSGATTAETWAVIRVPGAPRHGVFQGSYNSFAFYNLLSDDDSTNINTSQGFGSPTFYKDGVPFVGTPTRGDIYDAFVSVDAIETSVNGDMSTWPGLVVNGLKEFAYAHPLWVGELLIFDRALTTAERNQLGGYLALKWGITWTDIV